jgi:hypothetical protein
MYKVRLRRRKQNSDLTATENTRVSDDENGAHVNRKSGSAN